MPTAEITPETTRAGEGPGGRNVGPVGMFLLAIYLVFAVAAATLLHQGLEPKGTFQNQRNNCGKANQIH